MQRAEDWLGEAEAERDAARTLLAGEHWSWCCFTCQQVAEKALKALSEHFRNPLFGHNLNMLVRNIERHAQVPNSVRNASARLNRYYIPARYPNAFAQGVPADQFFENDAQQALRDAEAVYEFAQRIIGPS